MKTSKKLLSVLLTIIMTFSLMLGGLTTAFAAVTDKAITAFDFATPAVTGTVDEAAKTVALTVPFGTDVTALVPTIVHTGASVSPDTGVVQNFTSPVTYTVTAADASFQAYTVTVTVDAASTDATLTSTIGTVSTGGTANETITAVPFGTTLADFKAAITQAANATFEVYEADGTTVATDLASTYKVIVTAQDGTTTVTYAVTVDANAAPTASAVTITGTAEVGQTLTGSYTYNDADGDSEGTSTYKWYADAVEITGANAQTYVLTSTEQGATITFEVTPVASTGTTTGTPVMSSATSAVAPAPDTTAPTLSATSASAVTDTTAALNFTSDEAGTYYYLVYVAADAAPTVAEIKAQGLAVAKDTATASAAANTANVTGMIASTAYNAYVIVEDAATNASVVSTIAITTTAAPVEASVASIAATNGTVTITLAAKPTVAPVAGDFTATSQIDAGTANTLALAGFNYDNNVTVTYTFTPVAQTVADQSVVVVVTLATVETAAPSFTVAAANNAPTVTNPIADTVGTAGGVVVTVDASSTFVDADGDLLTLSVASGTPSVATVVMNVDGTTVEITPLTAGTATITVTADDGKGGTVTDMFDIVVAADTTAPVITMLGITPVDVANGAAYTDAGATASDDVDGDITASIVTTITNDANAGTTFDSSVGATYTYHYNVSDAAGNAATEVTRTVVVAPAAIATAAIVGVTAPVTGATPTATIADTTEYTATITWSPVGATFAASTAYTATITITPKSGYTLTGVATDFFTVAGATATTNAADSGVITAVFPATADPIQLTITDPTLTLTKVADENTTAAVTAGALIGVVGSDTVTVNAVANYDTATVGIDKTITIVYTLGGANVAKYVTPVNYTVATGEITVAPAVTSVTVDPATATVVQGGTQPLTATVVVVGGAVQTVDWTSSDPKVTVDATGIVTVDPTAPAADYTITAISTVDGTKTGTSIITVTAPADKTALTAAINAEYSDATRTTNALTLADYTGTSWTAYADAIAAAIAVEENVAATQTEVNGAEADIVTAKTALEFAGQAALDTAIAAESALTSTDYVDYSAVTAALGMVETTNAEKIDKTTAINNAIAGLVTVVDAVDALIAALPAAGTVTLADQAEIEAARAAYDVLTPAQQALVADVTALEAAEAELAILTAADAALLADADAAVIALEAAIDTEDLAIEANLTAAEALVAPAQAAVDAAVGITGIDAIATRLTDSEGIVTAARIAFDDKADLATAKATIQALSLAWDTDLATTISNATTAIGGATLPVGVTAVAAEGTAANVGKVVVTITSGAETDATIVLEVATPVTPAAPSVTNDDTANTVTGMAVGMEYNLDAAGYVVYDAITFDAIDLSGDHTLLVRIAAEGINPVSADTTLTFTAMLGEDKKVTSITGNNILLVGDYAFDLSDPLNNKYDLNNFLVAANTAYSDPVDTYHVYFKIGDAWYDIISDPDMLNQITDLTTINGDGLFNYMNMQ